MSNNVKLHFCKSKTIGGLLIRLITFSQYNHVAIEVNGLVWDSTLEHGVRVGEKDKFKEQYSVVDVFNVEGVNSISVSNFLRRQLGKEYDWSALVALPFRKDWQHPERWFCSELVAAALSYGGWSDLIFPAYRVTPRDLRLFV